VTIWLAAAAMVLLLNIGYGVRNVIRDMAANEKAATAVGIICLVGVNAIIVWMIYIVVSTSSDF